MTKTIDNLKAAFAGESQANRRYTAFAKKAEADGYPNVARLFRAAAAAELCPAGSGADPAPARRGASGSRGGAGADRPARAR